MAVVKISYKVPTEKIEENKEAVKAFMKVAGELGRKDFHYKSLHIGEGKFEHFFWYETEQAKADFQAMPEFKPFSEGLKERAIEGPTVAPIEFVASTHKK